MGMLVNTPRIWRFGVFELDASSGELRRNGTVVKLREQPARILLLLLEHAGQMVRREQLRQHLWPSDTFVDFDHSLNSAVMKLREALGDSADKPLYIETIPKKGYRFVAPVSQPGEMQNGEVLSRLTAGPELTVSNTREQSNGSVEVHTITPDEKQDCRRLLSRKVAILILLGVSAIGIAAFIRSASLRSALVQFGSQPKPSSGEPNMMSSNLSSSILTSAPGDARSPSFSPDGRQITFVWNGVERTHYDIYVQLVGSDTPLQITHHKRGDGVPGPPQWSPDGREIAFARCNSDRDGVYTVPALGGPERRLTNSPCRDAVAGRPIWTPDSKAMVMLDQCTPGGPRSLVLFSFATGEKRCLAAGSHGDFAADDALSPDGRTVAFYRFTDSGYSQLYAVPLTGGPPRLVSDGTTFWNPMWTHPTANTSSSTRCEETCYAPGGCRSQAARSNLRWSTRAWVRSPRTGGSLSMRRVRGGLPVTLLPRQSGERIFRTQAAQYFVQRSSSIHSSWRTLPNPLRTGRVLRCNQHVPAQTRYG
jgi:DNA-binding winged helix-turn-helix (wHTH) protein/Tol biopolymer transport system component